MSLSSLRQYYYSRYGLADVLISEFDASRSTVDHLWADLTEEQFEEAARRHLDALKRSLRLRFPTEGLVPGEELRGEVVTEPSGEKGVQVGSNGFYVRPHVLLDDGALNGYYGLLQNFWPDGKLIQRFYPPASKLSLGKKSAGNVQASNAFALACQVTTLTTLKAARRSGASDRAAIIPDLPLEDLIPFLRLLGYMQQKSTDPTRGIVTKSGESIRLSTNRGTFPSAPPDWAFGAIGVVSAIGAWARENRSMTLAEPVLDALDGRRLYLIDTSGTSRVETVGHHLVAMATEDALQPALEGAWKVTTNAEMDEFYRVLRRWLLLFNRSSFQDFLAVRALYPSEFSTIIDRYVMQQFDDDLIASARAAAQHVNRQAWFAADGSGDSKRTNQQTILASLESLLFDCNNGPEMIARLSVQVGRLTGQSFPPEAQTFFDATTGGAVNLTDARNLLLAYMRLRPAAVPDTEPDTEASMDAEAGDAAGLDEVETI